MCAKSHAIKIHPIYFQHIAIQYFIYLCNEMQNPRDKGEE